MKEKKTTNEEQVRLKRLMLDYGIGQDLLVSTLSKYGTPVRADNPLQKVPSSRARMILDKEFIKTIK